MRWMVIALGVIGLAGGLYLGLRPRLGRPVLRLALDLEISDLDDDALAAGMDLALDERDFRAGRYRVTTAHQRYHTNGSLDIPRPRAHTMMYGMETPESLTTREGDPLLSLNSTRERNVIHAWMGPRKLERLEASDLGFVRKYRSRFPGEPDPTDEVIREILDARPDAIYVHSFLSLDPQAFQRLRQAFAGPIFIQARELREPSLRGLDTGYLVLTPLRPAPPDFVRRHPHPFAYAGYRGTLRYLDAVDANPGKHPRDVALGFLGASIFEELRGEPTVFEIQDGRLVPPK